MRALCHWPPCKKSLENDAQRNARITVAHSSFDGNRRSPRWLGRHIHVRQGLQVTERPAAFCISCAPSITAATNNPVRSTKAARMIQAKASQIWHHKGPIDLKAAVTNGFRSAVTDGSEQAPRLSAGRSHRPVNDSRQVRLSPKSVRRVPQRPAQWRPSGHRRPQHSGLIPPANDSIRADQYIDCSRRVDASLTR